MFNFTSKIQTVIVYFLAGIIISLTSALIWTKLQFYSAKADVVHLKEKTMGLESDFARVLDAEQKCSKVVKNLVLNTKKKHKIITKYKAKIKGGIINEKINNISDFINYADSLQ